MKKTFFLLILFFFTFLETFACICGSRNESFNKQIKRAFNNSDLIFTGKVIEIKTWNKEILKSSADPITYKFEIFKIIKGKTQKSTIEISSETSGISCGYEFELGKTYGSTTNLVESIKYNFLVAFVTLYPIQFVTPEESQALLSQSCVRLLRSDKQSG